MSKESIETLINEEVERRLAESGGSAPMAMNDDGLPGVIIRAYSSGVFAGYLYSHKDSNIELYNSRYCRSFSTAGTTGDCGDLAMLGLNPKKTSDIRPPVPRRIISNDHVEIIYATEEAMGSIMSWSNR